jgi:hypothetical protein
MRLGKGSLVVGDGVGVMFVGGDVGVGVGV